MLVWEKVAGLAGAAAGGCEAMELRKARFFNGALPLKKPPRKKKQEFRTQRIQNSCPLAFTSIGESLSAYLQADFNIAPC